MGNHAAMSFAAWAINSMGISANLEDQLLLMLLPLQQIEAREGMKENAGNVPENNNNSLVATHNGDRVGFFFFFFPTSSNEASIHFYVVRLKQ